MANKKNEKKLLNLVTKKKNVAEEKENILEIENNTDTLSDNPKVIESIEKVHKLLDDIKLPSLSKSKEDEIIELSPETEKGIGWLEEQVKLLSSENEILKMELSTAKENYSKIFEKFQEIKSGTNVSVNEGQVTENVIKLFNELQYNYFNMGYSQTSREELIPAGTPNFRIVPVAFMNRLIMYFPFLSEYKKFN